MAKHFPFFRQFDSMDCGPACLRMISAHYGRVLSLESLRAASYIDREGVSMLGLSEAAEELGYRTIAVRLPFESDEQPGLEEAPLPFIAHWKQRHFVVVYALNKRYVWVADPAIGRVKMSHSDFKKGWCSEGAKGLALLLEPGPDFFAEAGEKPEPGRLSFLTAYLKPYKALMWQLALGVVLASFFQLAFPLLTQAVVDIGIQQQNLGFIYLALIGQFALFAGQLSVQLLQSWILLHIGSRINIALLTDFLYKLMRLPLRYFDTKMTGDLMQRIADQRRIESFLTQTTLNAFFSIFQILVFGLVLLYYHWGICLLFMIGSAAYLGWAQLFMRKRAIIDRQRFAEQSDNQSTLLELLQAMPDIRLQHSAKRRRWQWANIQARLFRINIRLLALMQYQDSGAAFITHLKDILITFMAAKAVLEGQMTLGMMLAAQYMVGQLNAPLQQLLAFSRAAQDAKISMERLAEIQQQEDEEPQGRDASQVLPAAADIQIENLSFQYNKLSDFALQGINLTIPYGKTTAIVGASGSGKTTLIKLLLGFYEASSGSITIGGAPLPYFSKAVWRRHCGAVLQDGFIFSDSIARNIAESDEEYIDRDRLVASAQAACIYDFIAGLPLGFNTKVGARGNGLSQGQRQRLLIARAIYKAPDYLFFDEATNALDATNEKNILDNLRQFFAGRTAIVVAHRLSTVKDADQIVVLDRGKLVETGTHKELAARKGVYYQLVKNQLELGS